MIVIGLTNMGGNWLNGEGWNGCGYHRILNPLGNMQGVQGFVADEIAPDSKFDILLYNRVSQYDDDWNAVKELHGCKVVLDLDDYWRDIPLMIRHASSDAIALRIENNIRQADLVIVTNAYLAQKALQFNDKVVVIENGLLFNDDSKISDEKLRIFWAGSYSHVRDMYMLKKAISYKNRLLNHVSKIKMVIGGYDDRTLEAWDSIVDSMTLDRKIPYQTLPSLDPLNYMTMYQHADIMVIPLEDSSFNHGKSNLKLLEAASKRLPVIVSNVYPYNADKDAPVLWVDSPKDWYKHFDFLINNKSERERLGNALHDWANEKYSLHLQNKKRYLAFKYILN